MPHHLKNMSLRELDACRQAYDEFHGLTKEKPKPMSIELLRRLGVEGA